jgi:hypothetical protein
VGVNMKYRVLNSKADRVCLTRYEGRNKVQLSFRIGGPRSFRTVRVPERIAPLYKDDLDALIAARVLVPIEGEAA